MSKKPPRKACTRSVMPAAATAAATLLLLTACGSGTDGDTVTLQFWDNNAGPDRTPLWEHIIEEFEADNPDINVEYVGIPIDSVQQKYDTAIAGDSLPDVGLVSTAYLSNVAARAGPAPAANSPPEGVSQNGAGGVDTTVIVAAASSAVVVLVAMASVRRRRKLESRPGPKA